MIYEGISASYWNNLKRSADRPSRMLDFTITPKYIWELYLKQNKKCALTGHYIEIRNNCHKHNRKTLGMHLGSLDRIDSQLGYIPDNVQWVCADINVMKWKFNQEYFVALCRDVVKHYENTIYIS